MDAGLPHLDTPKAVLIAGLLGSVLSLNFVNDMGIKQKVIAVVFGMVMAHYLTPLIAHVFDEKDYQDTIGFLTGLFGMSINAAVFKAIKRSDIWGLLRSRFGGATETAGDK